MYYYETTDSGWQVGDVPQDSRGAPVQVYMVPE